MRRSNAFLAIFAIISLASVGQTSAAIMAIDLGSEFLKISIVKAGRIPISIVNNEMSKRKSPAAVAFINGDRLVGDEASALAVRYPDRVFTHLREFLGRRFDDPVVQRLLSDARLPFTLVQAPNRTSVAVQVGEGKTAEIFTAEELVASLLEYAKRLAISAADGSPVTDCVLVVPAFWSPAQRQALLDAADLAGLKVMSLVHTHAAAALQYGIERDFTNKTEDVIFYDIGSGAVEAALIRFSAFLPANAPAGTAATSQFEVRDVAWVEHGVGCGTLEMALVDHFAKQHDSGADEVLSTPRAVAKLRKQLKRTKEVLSANSEAPVIVEELLAGQDFRGRITREEFEEVAGGVWHRAAAPLKEILSRNNITVDDLGAVEVLGGCSRVPRVKTALAEVLGGRNLDMHMDADEAVVLGAGLFAANLSTIFRLRKFGMTDKAPYAVTFNLEGADEDTGQQHTEAAETEAAAATTGPRVLVPALKKIPTKRAIALHNLTTDSFSVSFEMDNSAGAVLPCCVRQEELGNFQIEGIKSVVDKYGYSGKVAVHTLVDQSGVFHIDRADASVEIEEEMKIKVAPPPSSAANDTVSVPAGEEGKSPASSSDDTPTENGTLGTGTGGSSSSSSSSTEENEAATTTPKEEEEEFTTKKWKRTLRVPLNITGSFLIPSLTPEQRAASRRILRMLRERDEIKRATAKARNDLEAYVINTRDKLDSDDGLKAVSTEEQREAIFSALMDAEDWLYGDGDGADATELKSRLRAVRKGGDAIEFRAAEAAARHAAVDAALSFVELAMKAVNAWPTMKPWLNETEVAAVVAAVEEFKSWVNTSAAEQETRAAHEDPVFKVTDVAVRMDPVKKMFNRVNTKTKPIEKPPPKIVEIDVKEGNSTTTSTSDDGVGMEKETIPDEEVVEEGAGVVDKESGGDGAGHDEL